MPITPVQVETESGETGIVYVCTSDELEAFQLVAQEATRCEPAEHAWATDEEILAKYRDQLPLSARSIFYRLVGVAEHPKTKEAFEAVKRLDTDPADRPQA